MAYLGKVNIEKIAPDHPFSRGCILFTPTPKTKAPDSARQVEDVKELSPEEITKQKDR